MYIVLSRESPLVLFNIPPQAESVGMRSFSCKQKLWPKQHFLIRRRQFAKVKGYPTKNQRSFKKESFFHSDNNNLRIQDSKNVGILAHSILTLKNISSMNIGHIHAEVEIFNCLLTFGQVFNAIWLSGFWENHIKPWHLSCIFNRAWDLFFSVVCLILWCLLSSGLFASPILAGIQRIGGWPWIVTWLDRDCTEFTELYLHGTGNFVEVWGYRTETCLTCCVCQL